MARAKEVQFEPDEISDDVFGLVLNWRKEVRQLGTKASYQQKEAHGRRSDRGRLPKGP